MDYIHIRGARTHNLKNISLDLPRDKMIVITGLSGSGKSSLAFDTLYAEGQRRYVESLSAYARQFLNQMQKPDVDEIVGLSPAISIDQKSAGRNPRSTVATITEIYDYLRVLYARVGKPYCVECGSKIQKLTNEEIMGMQQLSLVNGKTLEQNTKEVLGGAKAYATRNKLVINEKQVLKDVSKASASLKLSLGGSAEAVAEAAVKARQFGLNLEQAEKMSSSLLDFESSIESELSAELLLGKDLNFERARGLALNGDTAAAAEEIAKQVGTSADFAKMNVIQQEAIAKAAGLTKDELAQSLMDREALANLSGVEGANAKEKFDNLVKEVGMEEAKKRLGNDQLASQYEQLS